MRCMRCKGIIRDASSCEGETVCKLCSKNQLNPMKVQKVRNSVADLNIRCPLLRDCGWSGKLLEGEKHLKVCDRFLIACPLECGDVMKRCVTNNHLRKLCLHREVECEFCDLVIIYKNLNEHLKTCPAHPIVCKCGLELRRDAVREHIDKDCELTEIECPYANYSCKIGKIPRNDLLAHKEDFYIEHQDMIGRENFLLTKQVKTLKLHNSKIMQKHEQMEKTIKTKNDQLVQNHLILEERMKTKNDQLVQKHDLLERRMKTKNDQLVQKHNTLEGKMEAKHNQLLQRCTMMDWIISMLLHEIQITRRLIGTAIALVFRSRSMVSKEFDNAQIYL